MPSERLIRHPMRLSVNYSMSHYAAHAVAISDNAYDT